MIRSFYGSIWQTLRTRKRTLFLWFVIYMVVSASLTYANDIQIAKVFAGTGSTWISNLLIIKTFAILQILIFCIFAMAWHRLYLSEKPSLRRAFTLSPVAFIKYLVASGLLWLAIIWLPIQAVEIFTGLLLASHYSVESAFSSSSDGFSLLSDLPIILAIFVPIFLFALLSLWWQFSTILSHVAIGQKGLPSNLLRSFWKDKLLKLTMSLIYIVFVLITVAFEFFQMTFPQGQLSLHATSHFGVLALFLFNPFTSIIFETICMLIYTMTMLSLVSQYYLFDQTKPRPSK